MDITQENNDIIIRFSKDLISNNALNKFIEMLRLEELSKQNQMTEQQAFELSEELKENWWNEHKGEILSRINKNEDNS
jgi:hypothetical protein